MKSLTNFPPVALFHGGRDQSIPSSVCDELRAVLKRGEVPVTSVIYPKMSHTDPILENVLAGETYLIDDITQVIEDRFATSSLAAASASGSSEDEEEEEEEEKKGGYSRFQRKPTQQQQQRWKIQRQEKEKKNRATQQQQQRYEAPVMVSRKLIYFARIMNPF
jgi:hypothetical protein